MIGAGRILPLVALGVCLAGAGCEDGDSSLCTPGEPAGRIQGTVRAGGIAVAGSVLADRIDSAPGSEFQLATPLRADGTYSMDVQPGRYSISLRTLGWNLMYRRTPSDSLPAIVTVDATHAVVVADFTLASARVHVDVPGASEGVQGSVRLHARSPRRPPLPRTYYSGVDDVQNGGLDFELAGIEPWGYRVEVFLRETASWRDVGNFWAPGVGDSAASPWIELSPDRITTVTANAGLPARIQGTVRGAWLELGLQAPSIGYYTADEGRRLGTGIVGADGRFDDLFYVPEAAKIAVNHAGIVQWIGGADFASASVFSLQPGETITGVEHVESGLYVRVAAPSMEPGGGTIHLYEGLTPVGSQAFAFFDLVFAIPNLRPGVYSMEVEPGMPGQAWWLPQWFDRASNPAAARRITLGYEGAIASVEIVLERGGTIAGTIHDLTSVALEHEIGVSSAYGSDEWGSVPMPRVLASFIVQGLPDGDWKVRVSRRRPESWVWEPPLWYPGVEDWSAAQVITVRDHQDLTGIDFTLPPLQP